MKWLRYFFVLAVLTAAGCSSQSSTPVKMEEDANPAGEGVDVSAEAEAAAAAEGQ